MATEATEGRAALHQRLSAALEAALGEAVWEIEGSYRCPEHGKVEVPYSSIVDMDYRCWRCGQALAVERRPVDWDDPAVLWPRWERWATDRTANRVLRLWRDAAHAWMADADGTITAEMATAWEALLAKEVRDGAE